MAIQISMKQIDEAEAAALAARRDLLLPKPIATAGGQMLCWRGRIMRALELAEKAYQDGDKAKVELIQNGIQQLRDGMDKAEKLAGKTKEAYLKLCEDAGVQPDPLNVGRCDCEYCNRAADGVPLWAAESRLRAAVFKLVEPDPDHGKPIPVVMMGLQSEEGDRQLWGFLLELANAQYAYAAECERRGQLPQWGAVIKSY